MVLPGPVRKLLSTSDEWSLTLLRLALGVVMLPPTLVSLPFKLLLFVMVNGWVLVTHSLVVSFR